ncbi:PREDICTED: nanos homolog 3 [Ceratosolen solmsi marchali]|uniref:Nanos homolog 3 n=1 Tax=Ceratosolen solmsi marchali TaxID=326594 RepID=A0AAJ6YQQ6_9HYME|nr:PREDICTED: nanos homolog 3 [Ceratosolen solmsi marchali]
MARVLSAPLSVLPCDWKTMLFPFNPSLEDELNRLFTNFCLSHVLAKPQAEDIWEDFRHNGRDYEYCPDLEDTKIFYYSKKKNKKPLPTECVFCKNNGEDAKIYKTHLLKDTNGRILCPILRKYTCPICGTNGDQAHTLKYCPLNNKQSTTLASMNSLKTLRNSTGRRRSK